MHTRRDSAAVAQARTACKPKSSTTCESSSLEEQKRALPACAMAGERMAPHDLLEDPLVKVLEPMVNPIADQSGPGDLVSPKVPPGVPSFTCLMRLSTLVSLSKSRCRAANL